MKWRDQKVDPALASKKEQQGGAEGGQLEIYCNCPGKNRRETFGAMLHREMRGSGEGLDREDQERRVLK